MFANFFNKKSGFTVAELIVSLAILVIIATIITTFQRDVFMINRGLVVQLKAQDDIRKTIEGMTAEMRNMSPSELGGYPIEAAEASSFIFYSDIDSDSIAERVRYFIDGDNLKKGIVEPTGDPLEYVIGNEVVSVIAENLTSQAKPLFGYFNRTYVGEEEEAPEGLTNIEVRFRGQTNLGNEEVRIDDVAVVGDAVTIFCDSFGSSNSNDVSGWVETEQDSSSHARIDTSESRPGSPTTGHVRLEFGASITKQINVTGYQDISLQYYWRGDDDAESSDEFIVEWREVGEENFTILDIYGADPSGCGWRSCPWSTLVTSQLEMQGEETPSYIAEEIIDIAFVEINLAIEKSALLGNIPISAESGVTLRNLRRGL